MAKGWGDEDDVLQQIETTVDDEVRRARSALPQGEGPTHCEDCDRPIPQARRRALPGTRRCVQCQAEHDRVHGRTGPFNRRGSKDSQLR